MYQFMLILNILEKKMKNIREKMLKERENKENGKNL